MSIQERLNQALRALPGAVERMGTDLFVKAPLYAARRNYQAVYIDRALFHRLFSPERELAYDEMKAALEKAFRFTLDAHSGTGEIVGEAWIDRQADPLGLSLSGNLGSGRAYYAGGIFNIKGEKTPLATAETKKFSDGLLEMERCIWEALVANALQGSLQNGLSPVLAVLDMEERCQVGWREAPVRRGKIIRIDEDGALDRITHLFHAGKPLRREALEKCAERFGALEADKFIERIVHGTWSPGNISPLGHLIDFDTVCAVKGRSPQYSSTQWYHQNYFGYEADGQARILAAMAEDDAVNADKAPGKPLEQTMLSVRQDRIERRLPFLMGFENHERLYEEYKGDIETLCALWQALSAKSYLRLEGLSCKNPLSAQMHVFDFSAFFRLYPLQKRLGLFSAIDAVSLMTETDLDDAFTPEPYRPSTEIEQTHRDAVFAAIGDDFVRSEEEASLLKIAALRFVKMYDSLHEKIIREKKEDRLQVEARAYAVNEDRVFMFPAYTLSYALAEDDGADPSVVAHALGAMIDASRRDGMPPFRCDGRIFQEGRFGRILDAQGFHRIEFEFFHARRPDGSQWPKTVSLEMEGKEYRLENIKGSMQFVSRNIHNSALHESFYRNSSLHRSPTLIKIKDEVFQLTNIA